MVYRGLAVALICFLAACGQKGDLYIPVEPEPAVPAEAADPAEQGDEENDEE